MRRLNAILAVFLMVLAVLSGCAVNPMSVIKGNPEIKQFLADHPNADISVIRISGDAVNSSIAAIREICGPEMAAKPYYKVTILDAAENLSIYAFIDEKEQVLDCFKKIGGLPDSKDASDAEKQENKQPVEEKKPETKEEKVQDVKPVENKQTNGEAVVQDIKLESTLEDGKVRLKWTRYDGDDFQGYKVVWSDKVDMPRYPENGYVEFITDKDKNEIVLEPKSGNNIYAITVLRKDGKSYSNAVKFYKDKAADDDVPEPVKSNQSISLRYDKGENGEIKLIWDKYVGNDLEYYKIVWSQTNKDPMYPEDGYIKYITNPEETSMVLDPSNIGNGTNFYRVSTILNGFYEASNKDSRRINSNVVEILK